MSTESSNTKTIDLFQQEQDESSRLKESQEELRHQDENSELQKNSRSKSSLLEIIFQQ